MSLILDINKNPIENENNLESTGILFQKVWENAVIKNKILSFLKVETTTSRLLPNFRGNKIKLSGFESKDSWSNRAPILKENKYSKFDEIIKVSKMINYDKEDFVRLPLNKKDPNVICLNNQPTVPSPPQTKILNILVCLMNLGAKIPTKIEIPFKTPYKYLFRLYVIKDIVSFFPNITLKWLIEIYECIHYLSPLLNDESSSEANKNLKDLFYSKEKFESIKKSFSEIELNSTLNNLDSREEIKQMYKILTMVSHFNTKDYHTRYEEIEKSKFDYIFKYRDPTTQKSIIENFIKNIQNSDDYDFVYNAIGFLVNLLIDYDKVEYLKIVLNSFDHSDSEYDSDSDSELFHIVRSVEAFDVLYDTFKFRFEIKDILNRFFELQKYGSFPYGDYKVNDKILLSILNHFKTKNPEDYYSQCSKLDFKKNKKLFSNDFICNNYQDFKENILKCNESYENEDQKTIKEGSGYWATYFENIDKLSDFRYPVSKYLKLNQFITILESTPPQQKYSCKSNPEILAWIYENRECDLKSGRCIQPNNITLFGYLFYTNQLSKALNDID
ncbi:hypothetical protein ACTFIY_003202 [Dictyostelium cf. discoideum]